MPRATALQLFASQMREGVSGRDSFDQGGITYLASHHPLVLEPEIAGRGWSVIATRPMPDVLAPIAELESTLLAMAAVAALIVAVLSVTADLPRAALGGPAAGRRAPDRREGLLGARRRRRQRRVRTARRVVQHDGGAARRRIQRDADALRHRSGHRVPARSRPRDRDRADAHARRRARRLRQHRDRRPQCARHGADLHARPARRRRPRARALRVLAPRTRTCCSPIRTGSGSTARRR